MQVRRQTLLSVFVVGIFAASVYLAKDWELEARTFPWVIGIPMLFLGLVQLALDLRIHDNANGPGEPGGSEQGELGIAETLTPRLVRKRTINIFSWIFGFLALIWLVGFQFAVLLVVFGYLKIQSREGWFLSLGLTTVAGLFLWGIFDHFLHLPFPRGFVLQWVDQLYS